MEVTSELLSLIFKCCGSDSVFILCKKNLVEKIKTKQLRGGGQSTTLCESLGLNGSQQFYVSV